MQSPYSLAAIEPSMAVSARIAASQLLIMATGKRCEMVVRLAEGSKRARS